jgi:aspartyl/asparaginyl beta-hydroxylase (cupin superfamily)
MEDPSMKYFKRILNEVPTEPLLNEIASVDDAWAQVTGRQDKIAVQREALAIPLRGMRKSMMYGRKNRDVHESRWTTVSEAFPLARAFITDVATRLDADLSRGKIVCLPAGRVVYPHIDRGEYYRFRGRYHMVLKSTAGSWMKSGDEEVRMREGELWWFDNDQMHEARNDGDEDRIHIIFDLLPASMRDAAAAATERARLASMAAA